jgi:hypothetical protein
VPVRRLTRLGCQVVRNLLFVFNGRLNQLRLPLFVSLATVSLLLNVVLSIELGGSRLCFRGSSRCLRISLIPVHLKLLTFEC